MRHPTGRPFLYFLAAVALGLASIVLIPVLTASIPTFRGLTFAMAMFIAVPFMAVPYVIFQFERRWIQCESAAEAMTTTHWVRVIATAGLAAALFVVWLNIPTIVAWRFGPVRPMTDAETARAVAAIRAWDGGDRGELSVLLAQLAWRWLPNTMVNAALSQKVRGECGTSGDLDYCYEGLQALFALGAQTADLAPVLVKLSARDPEVPANWRNTGFLVERGEPAHRYRSMTLDMLGLLGPAAADAAQPELLARLSDAEERTRWAAAGALDRLDSPTARSRAGAFFARNVPTLIDSYHVNRSRRLRACLFLLRAELNDSEVRTLALAALDDSDVRVGSCGAFLVLTSGVRPELAESRLLRALETQRNHYSRDSAAAALEILGTPRARQTMNTYKAWQPERIQRIRDRWNDRYFRLFGELL
jgi:hypothetical protein